MIKIAFSAAVCALLATASTTMCFKKDHMDPSNIEITPLEGGECKGKLSVKDMQSNGYNVSDIKITVGSGGMNYMYVFSKQSVIIGDANTKAAPGTQVLTKEQLKLYLADLKEEEELEKKQKEIIGDIALGKEIYTSQCINCHGEKAEKSAYGVSKPLNTLEYKDFENAIEDYDLDRREGSYVFLMKPYAASLTEDKVKGVAAYIRTLK
jgi:cytochrome c553